MVFSVGWVKGPKFLSPLCTPPAQPDTSISDHPKKIPKIGGENIVKMRWVSRKDKDLDKMGWNSKIPKAKKSENGLEMGHPPNLLGTY